VRGTARILPACSVIAKAIAGGRVGLKSEATTGRLEVDMPRATVLSLSVRRTHDGILAHGFVQLTGETTGHV